jgi:hypothetical protein
MQEQVTERDAWHGMTPPPADMADAGSWESIGSIADRMVMAFDETEEREEARNIARYSTDRQRARMFQAFWLLSPPKWRAWALDWLRKHYEASGE